VKLSMRYGAPRAGGVLSQCCPGSGPWEDWPPPEPSWGHRSRALSFGPRVWLGSMKQYRVVGFDAKDARLYEVVIEAPNQAIARMMVLAQMCRNFATAPLADRTDKLVVRLRW
jgi:hypothetical protein